MTYLLLVIIFLVSQFFSHQASAQNQPQNSTQDPSQERFADTIQIVEFGCYAFDPATLKGCFEEIKKTGVPIITITAPIICESREDCEFEISGANTDVTITAAKREYKIIRKNDFSYRLLTINSSSGIKFIEVFFEDENKGPCPTATTCPPVLTIFNSKSISITKSGFNLSKGTAISMLEPRDISITYTNFESGFKNAIEVSSNLPTQNIIIEHNLFKDMTGQAITFQAFSLNQKPSSISSNEFINNRSKGDSSDCIYPCPQSQLKITGPTANLNINKNRVLGGTDTIFDLLGLYASGIEIGNTGISKVSLHCNEISGNRGSGIVQSSPFTNVSEIKISENKIWGNGLNLNIPLADVEENNCYTKDCEQACAQ